jgi:hypothetical protein
VAAAAALIHTAEAIYIEREIETERERSSSSCFLILQQQLYNSYILVYI